MTRWTEPIYERFPWVVIGGFAALLPLILWGAWEALKTNNNNVRQWLPQQYEATQTYEWFRRHFPPDEFALVTWDGCTLDDQRLKQFADLIAPGPRQSHGSSGESEDGRQLFAEVRTGPQLLQELTADPFGLDRQEAIDRLTGWVIAKDGKTTCALVTLTAAGNADRAAVLQKLREIAVERVGVPESELHLIGEPIFNAKIDTASRRSIGDLPIWSGLIAASVALISLRSWKLTFAIFVVALYSGALAQMLVYVTGGSLNLVLVVMPVLVYLLSLSAAVHLANYYRDALVERTKLAPPAEAVRRGFAPCTLAAVTTAIGLGSLVVSHIVPVRDFGKYSALGILASLAVLFILLPSLLSVFARRDSASGGNPDREPAETSWSDRGLTRAARAVVAARNWLALGCGGLLAVAVAGIPRIETSVDPIRFFPEHSRLRDDYAWVEKKFGPVSPVETVVVFDEQENSLILADRLKLVGQIQQKLADIEGMGATMSAATFVPRREPEQASEAGGGGGLLGALGRAVGASPGRIEYYVLNSKLKDHREDFVQLGYLEETGQRQMWRISGRAERQGKDEQTRFLDRAKSQIETFLQEKPDDWTAGVDVRYTGMVPLFFLAQRELLEGLFRSFLLAFLLIALLMVIVLRSLRGGLLAMLPNVFPAAVVFGGMGHGGWPIDIGSMLTASAAMGIAVDDTVHFLTWFRRGRERGKNRHEATVFAWRKCSSAMLQTTAIGGLGLLVYATSTFQPVAQFGLLIFVLLVVALVGDLVFLPALLASPAGRVFRSN